MAFYRLNIKKSLCCKQLNMSFTLQNVLSIKFIKHEINPNHDLHLLLKNRNSRFIEPKKKKKVSKVCTFL